MLSIPMALGAITVFALFLTSAQSVVASGALTAALVAVVHFYAVIAVVALLALVVVAVADLYARTAPGAAYLADDHDAIARARVRVRRH